MPLIYLFSACLILGMGISQFFDLSPYRGPLTFVTDILLGYIMMEVGLELVLNKRRWKSYLKDYLVAFLAAALPWAFCFFYLFYFFAGNNFVETLFLSRFAAPSSTGILFSMLAAAGLATTWIFRKVQILAILEDVDTILLLIPLQFLMGGTRFALLSVVLFVIVLIFLAWRYLHQLKLPSGRLWLIGYSIVLAVGLHFMGRYLGIQMEILLPGFVLGCMLYNPHDPRWARIHEHEHAYIEPEERPLRYLDRTLKTLFMLCVGLLLPKILFATFNLWLTFAHVLGITILSNLGKCVPIFFYRKEATLQERLAVSIAMFPRGEVGAGILVLAIEFGLSGYATTIAAMSLALNLLLTGVFVTIVVKLSRGKQMRRVPG